MADVLMRKIRGFVGLLVVLSGTCAYGNTQGDACALPYAKPDVNCKEYAMIEDSVLVYELPSPGVLSLPDCADTSFDSLILVTNAGANGRPGLPYRFILYSHGIQGVRIAVEKVVGLSNHKNEEQLLSERLILSESYLSDDERIMNVLRDVKRPLGNVPYVAVSQTTAGTSRLSVRIGEIDRENDDATVVFGSVPRPFVTRRSVEGFGMVDDIHWKRMVGGYVLQASGIKRFVSDRGRRMLCSYGKYYRFERGKDSFSFRFYYYVFDEVQELQRSRAVSRGRIEGSFDCNDGRVSDLRIQGDDSAGVAVEKQSIPFVSVEAGMMLESVWRDGSVWRKGTTDGKAWFGGGPSKGKFVWSVPVLLFGGARIPLDHAYPDSLEGKHMVVRDAV